MATVMKIGVIGLGQMGRGIAQVAATFGHSVNMIDISTEAGEKGLTILHEQLTKLVQKEKISQEAKQAICERFCLCKKFDELQAMDVVVEAISENEAIKFDLFKRLDIVVNSQAILTSNTSSISITKIAAITKRPDKVIGMHFMNPVPIMQLVEVIRGEDTSDTTFETTQQLARSWQKTVVVSRDYPGFIVNRILMPMINEACFALMEGVATAEDIDQAMKLGTNQPMGPLTLADFIGLDTCLSIMDVLHTGLGDAKYRPCPYLKRMVAAGRLGKKVGRGFYKYQ